MKAENWLLMIIVIFVVLCMLSGIAVVYSANNEPFYGISNRSELILQIAGCSILALLWIEWVVVFLWYVIRNEINYRWLGVMVFPALGAIVAFYCAWGYANDLYVWANNLIPQ